MKPLCDALVELVVADVLRELRSENAVVPAKESDGVRDERGKPNTRQQRR